MSIATHVINRHEATLILDTLRDDYDVVVSRVEVEDQFTSNVASRLRGWTAGEIGAVTALSWIDSVTGWSERRAARAAAIAAKRGY